MKTMMRCLMMVFGVITISDAQWSKVGLANTKVTSIAVSGNYIFAGSDSGVYRSSDNGTSWFVSNSGLTSKDISCLIVSGTNLVAGTGNMKNVSYPEGGGGIFISTNYGAAWNSINNGLPKYQYNTDLFCNITSLLAYGGKVFAGTERGGLCISTDNGASWNIDTAYSSISDLCVSGKNLFVSGQSKYASSHDVFCSKDSGRSWAICAQLQSGERDAQHFYSFVVNGSNIYAIGTAGSLGIDWWFTIRSTDNGDNWINNGEAGFYLNTLAVTQNGKGDTLLFAGRSDDAWINDMRELGGVLLSTNHGKNWTAVDSGLAAFFIYTLVVRDNCLFAGTDKGLWRRPLTEFVLDVKQSSSHLPENYSLSQNYPNPFNPATVISYQLPMNSHVTLKVFDILGRQVKTLVSEMQNAGSNSVQWDATMAASGVYFYTLEAGKFRETKRMLLLK